MRRGRLQRLQQQWLGEVWDRRASSVSARMRCRPIVPRAHGPYLFASCRSGPFRCGATTAQSLRALDCSSIRRAASNTSRSSGSVRYGASPVSARDAVPLVLEPTGHLHRLLQERPLQVRRHDGQSLGIELSSIRRAASNASRSSGSVRYGARTARASALDCSSSRRAASNASRSSGSLRCGEKPIPASGHGASTRPRSTGLPPGPLRRDTALLLAQVPRQANRHVRRGPPCSRSPGPPSRATPNKTPDSGSLKCGASPASASARATSSSIRRAAYSASRSNSSLR